MQHIEEKKKLADFTDRELLELLLSNQLIIVHEIEHIKHKLDNTSTINTYNGSFKTLARNANTIIRQIDTYLSNQDDQ